MGSNVICADIQSRQPFGTARFAPNQLLQEQKAARYRRHAEKFRTLASAAPLPAAAGALMDLARDYDRLAMKFEMASSSSDG